MIVPATSAAAVGDADAREVLARVEGALDDRAAATGQDGSTFKVLNGELVALPADNSGKVTFSGVDGQPISFGLPHTSEEVAREVIKPFSVYENGDGSRTVPIVKTDGSVQVVSIIDEPTAPTRFDFVYDLQTVPHCPRSMAMWSSPILKASGW